ncbi:kelch repeat-containing protein [Brevibacillus laterosporus]|uniref:Kelch repeat-containing protein n=1 Tax=Brevibacillus laterosporus TaxID=1465 RepID=UPI002E251EE1|nr:kelch repeat-containing protein [Brevibacillus laterosporus]
MNLKKIGLFALAMIITLFSFQTYSLAAEEMEWVKKAPMPTARYNIIGGSIVHDNKIYVYGGRGSSENETFANLEVYDPTNDLWETLPSSSKNRAGMAFVENQGKFYAIGGITSNTPTNIVEEYDPISKVWKTKQSIPTALRSIFSYASLDDDIYTFGGIDKNDGFTNLVYSFNPEMNSWVTKKPMPFTGSSVSFIKNNSIYVVHSDAVANKTTIYLYNHQEDTWTYVDEIPFIPVLRALNFEDKILFTTLSTLYYYDLDTKNLETINVPPLNRAGCSFEIVNGKLYVIGGEHRAGEHPSGPTSDVVELNLSDLDNPEPNPNPDPNPNPTGNALLVIYMDSGLIKEFEMTNEEIRNFTEWYEDRAKGNGREAYIVNKKYNIGPFNSRKDFISYSHIESFEVQEYSR